MDTRQKETKKFFNQLKNSLASFDSVEITRADLAAAEFNPAIYSEDIYLYRSGDDQFIYIYDNDDETAGRITVEALKKILMSVAARKAEEAFELRELEEFFNAEEVE
ncbi:hypothetical protein [Paenibacillus kribbensis]|uniref:hypothetical protein n=1 Tax=Paenibacillus kribbensis TaxID=172713 RepID=UPI0015C06975|nr:hypothetical protein [Paenibacillus kribbensis]